MPRYLYVVEDSSGKRTAHSLLRGAKLQIAQDAIKEGKIWRASVTESVVGRELYASLFNQDGLEEWTVVNLIEQGMIRKLSDE